MATTNYNNINPNDYVYSDLNARLPFVSPQDYTIVTDREAILQSIYRLLNTQEGEIPNYRGYGVDLKQYEQQPLGASLAQNISQYISDKIETFEPRVSIYQVNVASDFVEYRVLLDYYLKIKSTEEIIKLETVSVTVGM